MQSISAVWVTDLHVLAVSRGVAPAYAGTLVSVDLSPAVWAQARHRSILFAAALLARSLRRRRCTQLAPASSGAVRVPSAPHLHRLPARVLRWEGAEPAVGAVDRGARGAHCSHGMRRQLGPHISLAVRPALRRLGPGRGDQSNIHAGLRHRPGAQLLPGVPPPTGAVLHDRLHDLHALGCSDSGRDCCQHGSSGRGKNAAGLWRPKCGRAVRQLLRRCRYRRAAIWCGSCKRPLKA